MLGLHPFTGVAALAPHVVRALHERYPGGTLDVHWMYPTLAAPCSSAAAARAAAANDGGEKGGGGAAGGKSANDGGGDGDDDAVVPCREGFAVQGKFDPGRRNYKALWRGLGLYSADLPSAPPPLLPAATRPRPLSRRRVEEGGGGKEEETAAEAAAAAAEEAEAAARAAAAAAAAVEAGLDPAKAAAEARGRREGDEGGGFDGADGSGRGDALSSSAAAALRPLFVNVVGSGRLTDLGLPPGLAALPPLPAESVGRGGHGAGGGGAGLPAALALARGAGAFFGGSGGGFGGVRVYSGLPYDEYYDTLCRSEALLPLFSERGGYLEHKISSSVGASLSAALPMVVPGRGGGGGGLGAAATIGGGGSGGGGENISTFSSSSYSSSYASSSSSLSRPSFLSIYAHFNADSVVELEPGETEVAAAARLLRGEGGEGEGEGGAEVLRRKRRALRALRGVLNRQAASKLDGLMSASLGKPRSLGSQPPPNKG
jgi:hypothetical protein